MEENNIVLRAKKGDVQAFEMLVKLYESKIYDKLYQLRNENKVGTWIMRILINQCKKIYKQNELRNRKNVNLEDNIEKININEEKNDYSFVDNAIHRLDAKYREIIILYYFDN